MPLDFFRRLLLSEPPPADVNCGFLFDLDLGLVTGFFAGLVVGLVVGRFFAAMVKAS